MATRDEIYQRLLDKLKEVSPNPGRCVFCGNNYWTPQGEYISLVLQASPRGGRLSGGKALPLVPVSCTKCGNTHLINLLVLGFSEEDLDSLVFPPDDGKQ
jgi:hypothetical protein